jgi:proline iminopeptidase
MLQHPDPAVHGPAALAWCRWEDTHVATHPGHRPSARYADPVFRLVFARLVTHYWSNAAFLPDGQLLESAHRLAAIPVTMVHGRMDISGPADIAWALARALPHAHLTIVTDEGHGAGPSISEATVAATDRLAAEGDATP